jgi:hypothetical protein
VWLAGAWWPDEPDGRQTPPALRAPAPPRVAVGRRHAVQMVLDTPPGAALALSAPGSGEGAAGLGRSPRRASRVGARGEASARLRSTTAAQALDDSTLQALLGPLRWLGFVTVAGGDRGTGAAPVMRVTQAAEALRPHDGGSGARDVPEASGRVVVQSNLEVVAFPPLAAGTLLALDAAAEPRGHGQAARYALTRAAVASARRAGWGTGSIAARLEQLSGAPLPQGVRVTLADWDRHVERLRLRGGLAVLDVHESRVLDRLLADAQAKVWVERRVAPTTALIYGASAAAVRAWLLRNGEMPAMAQYPSRRAGDRGADTAHAAAD